MKYCILYQEGNGEDRIVILSIFTTEEEMMIARNEWDWTDNHIHYFGELDAINMPI